MREDLWGPIDPDRWRETPHLAGSTATELDVKAGRAVFYSPTGPSNIENTVHAMQLPAPALLHESDQTTPAAVVVIQAECGPRGVIAGYRPLAGGNGACLLEELEFIPESDPRFRAP
jgi:hypothetical protein